MLPSTDLVVPPIVIFLAVPHCAVVIAEDPLKEVPLIFLAFCSVVVVEALPLSEPVILINLASLPVIEPVIEVPEIAVAEILGTFKELAT